MKKATMFVVGILMIAMLVGFGATAAAPADPSDEQEIEKRNVGVFLEDEKKGEHCHPQWGSQLWVVGSSGGTCFCCNEDCDIESGYPCDPDKSFRI